MSLAQRNNKEDQLNREHFQSAITLENKYSEEFMAKNNRMQSYTKFEEADKLVNSLHDELMQNQLKVSNMTTVELYEKIINKNIITPQTYHLLTFALDSIAKTNALDTMGYIILKSADAIITDIRSSITQIDQVIQDSTDMLDEDTLATVEAKIKAKVSWLNWSSEALKELDIVINKVADIFTKYYKNTTFMKVITTPTIVREYMRYLDTSLTDVGKAIALRRPHLQLAQRYDTSVDEFRSIITTLEHITADIDSNRKYEVENIKVDIGWFGYALSLRWFFDVPYQFYRFIRTCFRKLMN